MNNPIFDQPNHDYWESLGPQEGMRLMFQYLIEIATITRDNKATDPESKNALAHNITSLQCGYLAINEHPLGDDVCKAIWCLLGRAFEIGQFSGMIDERAGAAAKYIRAWTNQQKSVNAKIKKSRAWESYALDQAKIICGGRTKRISQKTLADKILNSWPEKEDGVWPSRTKLIEKISFWDRSGEIDRNPLKNALPLAS